MELKKYCKEIYYYPRNRFLKSVISKKPFIVESRSSNKLIENLNIDNAPILFEGLHTTYPLLNTVFRNRTIAIRTHNVEHVYYMGLSKSENRIDKKLFFALEARKLKAYERIVDKSNYIFTISPFEHDYFKNSFGKKAVYLPVFHQSSAVKELSKKGKFALFHGDLRVADNVKAAGYLINIFKSLSYPLIIASSFRNTGILKQINNCPTITFNEISDNRELLELLANAHINVLPTFQKTGIKLKLINALFKGRHILVSPQMVEGTGLEPLCEIAYDRKEFERKVLELTTRDYTTEHINSRKKLLKDFNVSENAKKIIKLL